MQMAKTWTAFNAFVRAGFTQREAGVIAEILEDSLDKDLAFDRDAVGQRLSGAGLSPDSKVEALESLLRNCFWSERFSTSFSAVGQKTDLVRAGIAAGYAERIVSAIDGFVVVPKTREIWVPILHPLGSGHVVMCDFTHLRKPEMLKQRRAIVVSPRSQNLHRRCVVVPVSKTPPDHRTTFHHEFPAGRYPFFSSRSAVWAICDHVYTVAYERLWFVNVQHRPDRQARLSSADLDQVLHNLSSALALTIDKKGTSN
jgi:uncharacterized protein YifN (PemK superfamily)